MTEDDEKFLQDVKDAWQTQEEGLDSDTLRELRLRRYAALEAAEAIPGLSNWLPLGTAVAAAFALVIVLWPPAPALHEPDLQFGDAEILATQDGLEMLEELDFYAWLDAEGHREIEQNRG